MSWDIFRFLALGKALMTQLTRSPLDKRLTYCSSHYWVEYSTATRGRKLVECLYRYGGTTLVQGREYHMFYACSPLSGNFLLTDAQIGNNLTMFKPFILDMEELGIKEKDEYATT